MRRKSVQSGFTLIEVTIAVTLVALLSLAILIAIRVALNAEVKANAKLLSNRRVVGAQRTLQQQLDGFMPETAIWSPPDGRAVQPFPFFEGEPRTMRFVSSYSLSGASRGAPQILEYLVIPGDDGRGVRLIVNEYPYRGGASAGERVSGFESDERGLRVPVFFPIAVGARSFVLADRLASCRMIFLTQVSVPTPHQEWRPEWTGPAAPGQRFPLAVRIEMTALDFQEPRLHPITVTAPLRSFRDPEMKYVD